MCIRDRFGSDQGSDQKAADSIQSMCVLDSRWLFKFRQWCLQHCLHLMDTPLLVVRVVSRRRREPSFV
eukprot:3606647-Pyramimonas_sp.AAC.1